MYPGIRPNRNEFIIAMKIAKTRKHSNVLGLFFIFTVILIFFSMQYTIISY